MSLRLTLVRQAPASQALSSRNAKAKRQPVKVCATSTQDGSHQSATADVSGRRAALGSLAASIGAIALIRGAKASTAQDEIETIEAELNSSFAVDLGGFAVDHKSLIYGVFFGQWVALVGAAVGGLTARQRTKEVAELNARLSETNKRMRKQMSSRSEFIGDTVDEGTDEAEIVDELRRGKRALKEKDPKTAQAAFNNAMVLIEKFSATLEAPWMLERKARRGLSAAAIQMKDYQSAEADLMLVVKICEENLEPGERPELADAYGCLADMYTEWGQLDKAAEIYDKMIVEMGS